MFNNVLFIELLLGFVTIKIGIANCFIKSMVCIFGARGLKSPPFPSIIVQSEPELIFLNSLIIESVSICSFSISAEIRGSKSSLNKYV